jgi:hypothetical protein
VFLAALNLRCIERLYGDHGLDVMDVLTVEEECSSCFASYTNALEAETRGVG